MSRRVIVLFVAALALVATAAPAGAVVGGSPPTGAWKFAAAVIRPGDGPIRQRQICGAALLTPTWVVTAAHCTEELQQPGGQVVIGRADLDNGTDGDLRGIKSVRSNTAWSKVTQTDDIALLELDKPSTMPTISTMAADAEPIWDGTPKGTIIGWGATVTQRGAPNQFVLAAALPVYGEAACRQTPLGPRFDPTKLLCGGDATASACNGDSGGPLVATDTKGRLVVAGVSSFGPPVCGTSPSFYTRLAGETAWIQSITGLDPTVPVTTTTTAPAAKKPAPTTATKKPVPTTKKKAVPTKKKAPAAVRKK
ncbi:MAG: serine protease [Acidobacteria bacterium]|nr:serine protease [Acidobacteriota bacterium]